VTDTHTYDAEYALKEIARSRQRRDLGSRQTARLADHLAAYLSGYFGQEALETVGLALVHASAAIGGMAEADGLTDQSDPAGAATVALTNLLAFAGQRIVLDARAIESDAP
jgi:hypothetical protein